MIDGGNDEFGPAGVVAPIMDATKIAEGIVYLAKNEAYRKQCGEEGYLRVSKYYSFDAFIQGYKELYKKLSR